MTHYKRGPSESGKECTHLNIDKSIRLIWVIYPVGDECSWQSRCKFCFLDEHKEGVSLAITKEQAERLKGLFKMGDPASGGGNCTLKGVQTDMTGTEWANCSNCHGLNDIKPDGSYWCKYCESTTHLRGGEEYVN